VVKERNSKDTPYHFVLRLSNCDVEDKDMKPIIYFLKTHPDVDTMDISHNHLTFKAASELAQSRLKMTWLFADYNDFGDKGAVAISQLIGVKRFYTPTLTLDSNNIGDRGAIALAATSSWASISLNDNHIADAGFVAFANNLNLETLNLEANNITNAGAVKFNSEYRQARANSRSMMETLSLNWNHIGADGIAELKTLQADQMLCNLFTDNNNG
jgi:surface antigen